MFKFVLLFAVLFCTAQARFPKALQQKWGHLDNGESNSRIVGGSDAAIGEAPYIISLIKNYWNIIKSHMCGGSLITARSVLTAAHCTDGQDPTTLLVRYGTNALSSSQYGDMKVSSIRQHPNYNSTTISNDISILVLESAIKPSENVKLITVEQTDFIGGEPVQLFGWGLMDGSNQNSIAESLQTAKMNIVSQEECQAVWGEVNAVDAGMICTLHETQSACNGDSGGPLVSSNGNQVGVVSWGPSGCPTGEYMSVYTRTKHFDQWINDNKVE